MGLTPDRLWLACGLAGQALFASRFVWQWIRSEVEGRSVVPTGFWYLSLAGSLILLTYAIHRRDLVFMLGQGSGMLIYARNLFLIRRGENGAKAITAGATLAS
jgi:lipid-A-disaccharide synthase-like uncharacterized protein